MVIQKKGPHREKPSVGHIVIPYIQGLGESFEKICGKYGIQRKGELSTATGVEKSTCDEEYIGETSRTLGERYREHLKEASPIHEHSLQTGHNSTQDNFNIIGGGSGPSQDYKRISFTSHTIVAMPNLFQQVGICKYPWGILNMLRIQSMHSELLSINKYCSNVRFSSDLMKFSCG